MTLAIFHTNRFLGGEMSFHSLGKIRNCNIYKCFIAKDKALSWTKNIDILIISQQKYMLLYSLEAPHQGASNEYHNICFGAKWKKNIKDDPAIWSYDVICQNYCNIVLL